MPEEENTQILTLSEGDVSFLKLVESWIFTKQHECGVGDGFDRGWEQWAQIDLAAHLAKAGKYWVRREPGAYTGKDWRVDLVVSNAATGISHLVEFKCQSAGGPGSTKEYLFGGDPSKVTPGDLGPGFNKATRWTFVVVRPNMEWPGEPWAWLGPYKGYNILYRTAAGDTY